MTTVLEIGEQLIAPEELMTLLAQYQMLPQLAREILIDRAIAKVDCTPEEKAAAKEQFLQQNKLTPPALEAWMQQNGMTSEQFEHLVTRNLRIEKFKQDTWGNKIESYFLTRKSQLDRVVYSLIRTQEQGIAQELYFRIKEGEQPFSELAREYSQGSEAQTGGLIGPVELNVPHPQLAKMLTASQPGQLWHPTRMGNWLVIVRLEKFMAAQLDDPMRARLLKELFELWLQEQFKEQVSIRTLDANP
ncbi:MAG: peptidylprolyl isomerase [Moorea sp. SIO2B7]|nr:peptidylprolyl isomerase [Moorena sp. SIO2B7]